MGAPYAINQRYDRGVTIARKQSFLYTTGFMCNETEPRQKAVTLTTNPPKATREGCDKGVTNGPCYSAGVSYLVAWLRGLRP